MCLDNDVYFLNTVTAIVESNSLKQKKEIRNRLYTFPAECTSRIYSRYQMVATLLGMSRI